MMHLCQKHKLCECLPVNFDERYDCFAGSTTILIPPLSVIERQLCEDCHKYGIKVLVGSQVILHAQLSTVDCARCLRSQCSSSRQDEEPGGLGNQAQVSSSKLLIHP